MRLIGTRDHLRDGLDDLVGTGAEARDQREAVVHAYRRHDATGGIIIVTDEVLQLGVLEADQIGRDEEAVGAKVCKWRPGLTDIVDELTAPSEIDRCARGRAADAAHEAPGVLEHAAGLVKAEQQGRLARDLLVLRRFAGQARDVGINGDLAAERARAVDALVVVEHRVNDRQLLLPVIGSTGPGNNSRAGQTRTDRPVPEGRASRSLP